MKLTLKKETILALRTSIHAGIAVPPVPSQFKPCLVNHVGGHASELNMTCVPSGPPSADPVPFLGH